MANLWFVLPIGDLLDGRSMLVYPFVIPHLWALLTFLAFLAVIAIRTQLSVAVVITICALFATLATASFAMSVWPSSDHGSGTAWLLLGGFSLVNIGAALVLIVLATKRQDSSVKAFGHNQLENRRARPLPATLLDLLIGPASHSAQLPDTAPHQSRAS